MLRHLLALAERAAVQPDVTLPIVTLGIRGLHGSACGHVVRLDDRGPYPTGLHVLETEAGGKRTGRALFLDPRDIVTISVHEVERYASALGWSAPRPAPVPEVATKLSVRRELKAVQDDFVARGFEFRLHIDAAALAQTGAALGSLLHLVGEVGDALRSLAADRLGADALHQIDEVQLVDAGAGVKRAGDTILCAAQLHRGGHGRLPPEQLVRALAAVL